MRTLSEIDNQDASLLVCDHLICTHCAIIDRDHGRLRTGHQCSTCGTKGEGASLAFPISIHILVDLVAQVYHSGSPVGPIDGPQTPTVGTVLFFCALREALLSHFLLAHLREQDVPAPLVTRLMDDNKLAGQKFGPLFHSVVGVSWKAAVAALSEETGIDFGPVSSLMKEAAGIRNSFLHEGQAWLASPALATACVDSLPQLFQLFVALHNQRIHPMRRISARQSGKSNIPS